MQIYTYVIKTSILLNKNPLKIAPLAKRAIFVSLFSTIFDYNSYVWTKSTIFFPL
jgi:hypothetical protein